MSVHRHELPTHLDVPDRAFAGLTVRQLLTLSAGLALAYGAGGAAPGPLAVQLAVVVAVLAATAVLTLWRPAGRPADEWAFVLLRYWSAPRVAVWRPVPGAGPELAPLEVRLPSRGFPAAGAVEGVLDAERT